MSKVNSKSIIKGFKNGLLAGYLKLTGGTLIGNLTIAGFQLILTFIKTQVDQLFIINGNDFASKLDVSNITANRTHTLPDKDITFAGLDDIKSKVIVATTTPLSHTGSITETIKYTEAIPLNTVTTHDKIFKEILASAIGSAGNKTIRCYINTTPDLVGTPVLISTYFTNNLLYSLVSSFFIDSTITMKSFKPGNSNAGIYWGSSNASIGTFAINWGVLQYLVVTVQLAVNTDIIQLEAIYLKRDRK